MEAIINKGQALLDLLQFHRRRDNLSLAQLGERLGIDQSYLSQLFSGKKKILALHRSIIQRCADYLELPVVICQMLGGQLHPSDFFIRQSEYELALAQALETIVQSRPAMESAVCIEQLTVLPESVRLLVVVLYELAEGVKLLPERVSRTKLEELGKLWVPFEVRFNSTK